MTALTRRTLFKNSLSTGIMLAVPGGMLTFDQAFGAAFNKPADLNNLSDFEKLHVPKVTLPPVVEDGNQAPVIVEMDHPMEKDHYIKSIQILNFNDPVVIKGQCFFTPQSGEAFVSTQIRLAGGESRVWVVCECNQHGRWAVHKDVKVAAGGC